MDKPIAAVERTLLPEHVKVAETGDITIESDGTTETIPIDRIIEIRRTTHGFLRPNYSLRIMHRHTDYFGSPEDLIINFGELEGARDAYYKTFAKLEGPRRLR